MSKKCTSCAGSIPKVIKSQKSKVSKDIVPSINVAGILYALGTNNTLYTFVNSVLIDYKKIVGLAVSETALAIDVRPATGQVYIIARGINGSQLYTLNFTNSTKVTAVPSGGLLRTLAAVIVRLDGKVSIDFNPVVDRLRVITSTGQNFRVNVDTGITTVDTPLMYADTGLIPNIGNIAYTNSFPGATSTVLYGIDISRQNLVTINPPNNGVVNNVGVLGVSFTNVHGFDIQSFTNTAFAILVVGGVNVLFTINLLTGTATALSELSCCVPVIDFAVLPGIL